MINIKLFLGDLSRVFYNRVLASSVGVDDSTLTYVQGL